MVWVSFFRAFGASNLVVIERIRRYLGGLFCQVIYQSFGGSDTPNL
jgi:hypothetical protein